MKNTKLALTLLTLAFFGSSAWARGGMSTGGVANPASMQCVQFGGRLQLYKDEQGNQSNLCRVEGAALDEWTFYLATTQGGTQATTAFINHPRYQMDMAPNPVAYCSQLGGRIELFTNDSNERIGLCQFEDRSSIEAWTLFRGPRFPGNTKLLKLLTAAN